MKLVAHVERAWRWFSVQALLALTALPLVWMGLPDDLKAAVPETWRPWIVATIAIAGLVGRVVDQQEPDE